MIEVGSGSGGTSRPASDGGGRWRLPALAAALLALVAVAHAAGLGDRLDDLREWIVGLGPWGPLAFVAIYAAATVAALPGSVLTVAAGAMFGSLAGVAVVSVASTLGATLAFLVARFLARDAVARRLAANEKFARLDRLTREHGAIVVAITRLVPLFPFNLLNYGFGLTAVPLPTYVFWSWLCMLPGTVLYVVGADVVATAVAQGRVPWALLAALAVTSALLVVLVRLAHRALARREAGRESSR